jgi:microcystin-dependent protein
MLSALQSGSLEKSRACFVNKRRGAVLLVVVAASLMGAMDLKEASAQEPYLGEVRMFAGNFAPRGWANCDGQLLPISQNSALFSLLGTMYGGDGRTTFGLPDLRGRVPVHVGRGPGLPEVKNGQKGGGTKVAVATDDKKAATTPSYQGIRFIIATTGVYPSRN